MQSNYYEALALGPNLTVGDQQYFLYSADAIKTAYKKAAFNKHPDRNESANATEEFQLVNEANTTLSDPDLKREYDLTLYVPSLVVAPGALNVHTHEASFFNQGLKFDHVTDGPCDFDFDFFTKNIFNKAKREGHATFIDTPGYSLELGGRWCTYREVRVNHSFQSFYQREVEQSAEDHLENKRISKIRKKLSSAIQALYDEYIAQLATQDILAEDQQAEFLDKVATLQSILHYSGAQKDVESKLKSCPIGADLITKIFHEHYRGQSDTQKVAEIFKHFGDRPEVIKLYLDQMPKDFISDDKAREQVFSYITHMGKSFDCAAFFNQENKAIFPLINLGVMTEDQASDTSIFAPLTLLSAIYHDQAGWEAKSQQLKMMAAFIKSNYYSWFNSKLMLPLDKKEFVKVRDDIAVLRQNLQKIILKNVRSATNGVLETQLMHDQISSELIRFQESRQLKKYQTAVDHLRAVIGVFLAIPFLLLPIILSSRYRRTFFESTASRKFRPVVKHTREYDKNSLQQIRVGTS